MTPQDELLFLALGGSGEIGMNVNLYGCRGKWLMVDLGMTFSDPDYPGIDLILPDLDFIEERREDLSGIVLTHGHEDHIGAIPYLAADLGVPLYATPFTAGLIMRKLEEHGLIDEIELNVIDHLKNFEVGPFACRYIPLAHSIAEGNALVIETPHGRIFHTGDWKLDDRPLIGEPTTAEALTAIGDEGVLALVCDSTNVFNEAESGSEGEVRDALLATVKPLKQRVVVATFASNLARVQTLGEVARRTNRKLCIAGRSLHRIIDNAKTHGYLKNFPDIIDFDEAMDLPRREVMVLATGGQGEPRAALSRMADGDHPIRLEAGDAVLFSSKVIPGNELAIGRIQNLLARRDIDMITERQADIHVSGHPGRPELRAMYEWIRPEILVPVHGERRHMREQAKLGRECGIPQAIVQENGDVVRLAPGKVEIVGRERAGRLVLDGDVILPADGGTINERRKLGYAGIISVAVKIDGKGGLSGEPAVALSGVPVEEDEDAFIEELKDDIAQAMSPKARTRQRKGEDASVERVLELAARRAARRWTGKKPQVHTLVMRG